MPRLTFSLIEALLWDREYQRLERHLDRMMRSAAAFCYPFDRDRVLALILQHGQMFNPRERYKVRLELDRTGAARCEGLVLPDQPPGARMTITLSDQHTTSSEIFLYHKTTHRPLYQEAYRRAVQQGHTDVIFLNERNEVTEGAISNIFVKRGGHLLTPPVRCGLLAGIYRGLVLEEQSHASEEVLSLEDLLMAEEIYICNAVRGWRRVTLAPALGLPNELGS